MASTATTRNRLNKQGTGDNTGTWGSVLNTQAIDLVDEAMDGLTSITISGNVTLSSANYATDQARKRVLKLTGAPGATYIVTIPSVEKFYVVINATNAPQTIKAGGIGVSIPTGVMTMVVCDGTDCFTPSQTVSAVIGAIVDFGGSVAPSGWLLCYGQAISRTTYAVLFAVIGTTWGAGDGSTTFNVPDLRDRLTLGAGNMGGVASGRLTGWTLGTTGGSGTTTLLTANLPSHTHVIPQLTIANPATVATYNRPLFDNFALTPGAASYTFAYTEQANSALVSGATVASNTTTATGALSTPISIVQPAAATNKIIYAGV